MDISLIISKLKQYPIPVLCLVLSLLFLILAILRGNNIPEQEILFEELNKQMGIITENNTRGHDIQSHVDQLIAHEKTIEERLMIHEQKALNQGFFYQLEEKTGVKIRQIFQIDKKPLPKKAVTGQPQLSLYNPVSFKMTIEGEFSNVLDFMHQLYYGKYFTRIDDFTCRYNTTSEGAPVILSFNLKVLGNL